MSDRLRLTYVLCVIFFGLFGVHHFYARNIRLGILYILTLGMFGIGITYDFINGLSGTAKDSKGLYIIQWDNKLKQ